MALSPLPYSPQSSSYNSMQPQPRPTHDPEPYYSLELSLYGYFPTSPLDYPSSLSSRSSSVYSPSSLGIPFSSGSPPSYPHITSLSSSYSPSSPPFFAALDSIITEMNHRFNEVLSELLVCFSCLDPRESFSKFDVDKIARLMEIYDQDFSPLDRCNIKDQLETVILHVQGVDDFDYLL
ncbi:hypothetical protein OsI_12173 [Oryza sativa Indica Group]|uniref:Uncharacterized protein n=1 Tax=Oryza sativa subsp. indica TaxID=39946 RepID=B8AKF9_ORYSI|nr:hypothetical protein OsI_12173 [Oryza sativa Indica Group]